MPKRSQLRENPNQLNLPGKIVPIIDVPSGRTREPRPSDAPIEIVTDEKKLPENRPAGEQKLPSGIESDPEANYPAGADQYH